MCESKLPRTTNLVCLCLHSTRAQVLGSASVCFLLVIFVWFMLCGFAFLVRSQISRFAMLELEDSDSDDEIMKAMMKKDSTVDAEPVAAKPDSSEVDAEVCSAGGPCGIKNKCIVM